MKTAPRLGPRALVFDDVILESLSLFPPFSDIKLFPYWDRYTYTNTFLCWELGTQIVTIAIIIIKEIGIS